MKNIKKLCLVPLLLLAHDVQAASTAISDTPMAVKNAAKSNIMFTLDNSGGTDVDVLLTTYNSMYYEMGVTPTNNPYNLNGNFYLLPTLYREWGLPTPQQESLMLQGDIGSVDPNGWRARNYQYNAQYYNPFKIYLPWPGTNYFGRTFPQAAPTRALTTPPFWENGVAMDLTQVVSSGVNTISNMFWYIPNSGASLAYSWTPPQAHTFLSTTGTDITSSGGRYYNSTWYPATYYQWVDKPNFVSSLTLTSGGSGYTGAPTVNILGGGGTGATAVATITNGVVTAVALTSPGTGYTTAPTITFTGGGGAGAAATATVGGNGIMEPGEGVRYEIRDPAVSCTPTDPTAKIPGCAPVCPVNTPAPYAGCNPATYPNGNTYAQEIQNFANWFQYYRTPLLAMQGALGKQVETLGGVRVGVINLQSSFTSSYPALPPYWMQTPQFFGHVLDMSVQANVTQLRNNLYGFGANMADWRQPIHERLSTVFNYFQQPTVENGHPAAIQYACQQNFHVLSTPGYLFENGPGAAGFTNYFTGQTPPGIPVPNYDGTLGVPYADVYSDTVADWSAYFYNQNVRPDLTPGQVPITPSTHETNTNPHITQYVMSPGAQPTLQAQGILVGGVYTKRNPMTTDPWSVVPSIVWPQPLFVDETTVDDLWHAAVNGRGKFVNDTDIYGGLNTVLNDIFGRVGAAAAVAVSNANVSPNDNFSYASSYNSGNWTGDLQSYLIDPTTGIASTVGRWSPSAQGQLDKLVQTTTRVIATYNGLNGLPFEWASLDPTHQSLLNSPLIPPGPADGYDVLRFLRGDRLYEGSRYRTRGHVLGDIINAEPAILRNPVYAYTDPGYAAYKVQYTSTMPRTSVVFQPANDGMLHTFSSVTGAELWAYVPGLVFNAQLPGFPGTSKLVNLSLRSGFTHLYMVDGTPVTGDADFDNTTTGTKINPDWHAIVVGGLNKGGFGYYALDVTVPDKASPTATTALTETDVAAKSLWEFPKTTTPAAIAANVGYSYGNPYITKTAATGWVVLVTSGYNNGTNPGDSGGDGKGHLFVLDAKTGKVIKDIPTPAGVPGTPSGLNHIVGYADSAFTDNTTKFVYGVDLQGNVWRFDLTGTSTANWSVSLLAQLVDASGNPQPITTAPVIGIINGKRMVIVGTGQYLSDADVTNTQVQSIYALIDSYDPAQPGNPATITPLRSKLNQRVLSTIGGTTSRTIAAGATVAGAQGWYADLNLTAGERITTDPALVINTLAFTTNVPNNLDPCNPGGSSYLYTLDYRTGSIIPGAGAAGIYLGNALASRPILVRLPNGVVKALVRMSNANTTSQDIQTGGNSGILRRISWRQIRQQ